MKKLVILILSVILISLLFSSCTKDAQSSESKGDFKLEFLFEKDGCKMYRFKDGGKYIYWTKCEGSISYRYYDEGSKSYKYVNQLTS